MDNPKKVDDSKAMQNFQETLVFKDGRYQVTWPWKDGVPDLPVNRELALGRLRSSVLRMKNKPELMKKYNCVIQEQLNKGVIEKVENTNNGYLRHYIPHHAVINPLKPTTKLRIVYDASAKTNSVKQSLNECLYRGPVMLHDLCGILLRFRLQKVAVVADIEKAFLQIGLQPNQRDVTRFIWLKNCEKAIFDNTNLQEYRFCRVPFGVISSPFLLGATIETHSDSFNDELSNKLKRDIYVDNLITGTESPVKAIELYSKTKSIFREASMHIREWISNSDEVNNFIPCEDKAETTSAKVLGHVWNVENDSIKLKSPDKKIVSKEVTKRNVLKEIASIFDPLGLFSPIVLRGKILLQELWKMGLHWDETIDDTMTDIWISVKLDLDHISDYQIPRYIGIHGSQGVKYALLCFCDASANAYSAVVYLHQQQANETNVSLIFSKTRLAPLKRMTIPRLELMAVLIGVRCIEFVKSQLELPMDTTFLWTDSQCVLKWISSNKDLSVFVKNRVSEIKSHDIEFCYVDTKENPADIATRGVTLQMLFGNQLWWSGPQWLIKPISEWQRWNNRTDDEEESKYESEIKKSDLRIAVHLSGESSKIYSDATCDDAPFGLQCGDYSSVSKLVQIIAFALRFINKLRKTCNETGVLTASELCSAENLWLLYIQKKNYPEVFQKIANKQPNNLQCQLGLYIDKTGLLRCKGRMEHACLSEATRFPILLPRVERFTQLIIERIHRQILHSGVSQTLSQIRYKYWIPQGRATVRSVLRNCLVCRRHEGGPYRMPSMSPIPTFRLSESPAFARTGVDYFGPLFIKSGDEKTKVWVCLFTCLVTRAIHLEIIQDMAAEQFLLGFRRFISQRGTPLEIISDNALQFKTASKALDSIWSRVTKDEEVQKYVSDVGIKWTFIVERAPWMGGFYERLVGIVKRAFRKSLGRKLLTLIQLQTIVKEIEAVVNARPLVYVGDDLNSTITLTPQHFLTLNPKVGIPEIVNDDRDPNYNPYKSTVDELLQTWKKGQKLLDAFWKIWRDEYLLSLRERTQTELKSKRIQSPNSPNVGDVVILKDDLPRGCWKLGRIISLTENSDKKIRSAKVKISSGRVLGRPLNLLYPIEFQQPVDNEISSKEKKCLPQEENIKRPERIAAKEALNQIKQMKF